MHQASSLSSLHNSASRAREGKADMEIALEEGVMEGDIAILPFLSLSPATSQNILTKKAQKEAPKKMDPPPPYQATPSITSGTLHIPILQRAGDLHNNSPSRPTTPSPSTNTRKAMHRFLSHNLWQDAIEKLPEKDKKSLEVPRSGISSAAIIDDALAGVKNSEDKVNRNLIKIKTKKGEVSLRHYIDKLTRVLIQFREVGDTLVQYDPGHAALPWAGVRLLLNVSTSDPLSNKPRSLMKGAIDRCER